MLERKEDLSPLPPERKKVEASLFSLLTDLDRCRVATFDRRQKPPLPSDGWRRKEQSDVSRRKDEAEEEEEEDFLQAGG